MTRPSRPSSTWRSMPSRSGLTPRSSSWSAINAGGWLSSPPLRARWAASVSSASATQWDSFANFAFVRADALFWGLMFLLLAAVAMAWWESRLTVRQGVGPAVAGGALGVALTYGAILALAVIALSRCGT